MTGRPTLPALLFAGALCLSLAVGVEGARAAYPAGAQILSASSQRLEQADDGSQLAVVSTDSRFAAFQTRARNLFADGDPDPSGQYRAGGIFRRDLETGALELVADGDLRDEATNALVLRGAQNPSISGDGRYVVFSTEQKLVPQDTNGNIDVYVRDMDVPIRSAGAFELVSAKDGGDTPASYALTGRTRGAEVSYNAAISADGQKVVFRTIGTASDLPDHETTDTAPPQVFVRDRAAKRTILITHQLGTGDPAGGAAGPAGISRDGTTVIWTGENASLQTPFLSGEPIDDSSVHYLWQRFAEGVPAPTRRITGAVDLDDPDCPLSSTVTQDPTAAGPCYGPLTLPENGSFGGGITSELPALSADGYRVAFLTGAGPRPDTSTGNGLDLYVTDMHPGVSRKAGTVELTREGAAGDPAASSVISGISMSGDGRRAAFVTVRTRFVLSSPRFVGDPATLPDSAELYVLDLEAMQIERATRAFDGGEVNGDTSSNLSISGDGSRIAFTSSASNLFYGDSNDRADAFVVTRQDQAGGSAGIDGGFPDEPDAPLEGGPTPSRRLVLKVRRLAGGAIRLSVDLPGAGHIDVRALAPPPGRKKAGSTRGNARRKATRTVARTRVRVRTAGRTTLVLRLARRYRSALKARHGLKARLVFTFAPDGARKKLTAERRVAFTKK